MEHEDDAIVIIVGDENDKKSSHLSSIKIQEENETDTDSTSRALESLGNTVINNEEVSDGTEENYEEEFISDWQRRKYRKIKREQSKQCRRSWSFVQNLREQYPELAADSDLLISTLAQIMKNTKPPPPPEDHYVMNGAMFECISCYAVFPRKRQVTYHYRDVHGPKTLMCFSCGLYVKSNSNLYSHEKFCREPDAAVVLRARAISVGNRGRGRPFLTETNTYRWLGGSNSPESEQKSGSKEEAKDLKKLRRTIELICDT